MNPATVSSKGRVTIPAELRRKFDIKPGTRIVFEHNGAVIGLSIKRK